MTLCIRGLLAAAMSLVVVAAPPARAQDAAERADRSEARYEVSGFQLEYVRALPFLPRLEELSRRIKVRVVRVDELVLAPVPGERVEPVALGDLTAAGPVMVSPEALDVIADTVAALLANPPDGAWFAAQCTVSVSPRDIDPATDRDRRPGKRRQLAISITYEGPTFEITEFGVSYLGETAERGPGGETLLAESEIELYRHGDRWVSWWPEGEPMKVRLSEVGALETTKWSAGAIQTAIEGVRDSLREQGLMAIRVRPADGQIDGNMVDRRGNTSFAMEVVIGQVGEVRTLGVGERVPETDRINHPTHKRVLEDSPFGEGDVLTKRELDRYLFFLSRHPGRRVDAAIAPSDQPLGITLDYIVTENRPLLLYLQVANTGTDAVGNWRYRAGLIHNQLTGNDDILNLEYSNIGASEDNNAVVGSYEANLFGNDRARWRVFADWSEFSASELGLPDNAFVGRTNGVGGEISVNVLQRRELFLDVIGGLRYRYIRIENNVGNFTGTEDFLIPYAGLRLSRFTETERTTASVFVDLGVPDATGVDSAELENLGRTGVDRDYQILRWDLTHAFFVEPVVNRSAWEDLSTPNSSTLAHEIALRFHGQYSMGNRLIPQFQSVAGGLLSVRGYPESAVAGDTVLIGTVEYRLHLSQMFGVQIDPATFMGEPFRVVPQHPFGRADWDLIVKGFLDAGRTIVSDPLPFEENETLMSTGVGVQVLFKTKVDIRIEWGFVLRDVDGEANQGDSRVHFVATLLF